ncbi:MAG: hypothetical protein JKY54_16760 [Flavobacteriales bacterium]|nr:hypothetical protein [Flavobacteriales bacterium]
MRLLFAILFVIISAVSFSQEEIITTAKEFTAHVVNNQIDSALLMCSDFGKENYFENKKHIKFCRHEKFKNAHAFEVVEQRVNEARIKFISGESNTAREIYAKEYDDKWYRYITKDHQHLPG